MEVTVERVGREALGVVDALLQLYQYDFAEIYEHYYGHDPDGGDVDEDGRYHYVQPDGEWFTDTGAAFLCRVDGALAGFALAGTHTLVLESGRELVEFFVLRKHRGRGVGRRLAVHVFDALPGPWELRIAEPNLDGLAFWRKVVGGYTGGRYQETVLDDDRWRGPVQTFLA